MNQSFAIESMFNDDPFFFSQERLLQPLRHRALQQGFFNRRSELAHSLLTELCEGLPGDLLRERVHLISPFLRMNPEAPAAQGKGPSAELEEAAQARAPTDLSMSLDARGFSPEDITVKLEGRKLAVVAMKQAKAEEAQSCSSATSSSSSCSASSQQSGFAQRIDLPAHLDLTALTCNLTEDGHLRIHAPATPQPIIHAPATPQPISEEKPISEENQVPIRFRTSLDIPITKAKTEEEVGAVKTTHTA